MCAAHASVQTGPARWVFFDCAGTLMDPTSKVQEWLQTDHDPVEVRRMLKQPASWTLFFDCVETFAQLRERGVRIGIVSNWDFTLPALLAHLGLTPYLDFVVYSAMVGVEKPNRIMFDVALKKAQARPEAVLHVGDDYLADYLGARAAGLRALWLVRRERGNSPVAAHDQVRSLAEILDRLPEEVGAWPV